MNLNKVIVVGHLGADPEIRYNEANDSTFGTLSVATNFVSGSGENKKESTEWHKVAVSGQPAAFAGEYLKKGSVVAIEGRLRTRSYEADGATKYVTEIVASSIQSIKQS